VLELLFYEDNFWYFFGFGFIFALITSIFPMMLSYGVWFVIFPFFVLCSVSSMPPNVVDVESYLTKNKEKLLKEENIGIFYFVKKVIRYFDS